MDGFTSTRIEPSICFFLFSFFFFSGKTTRFASTMKIEKNDSPTRDRIKRRAGRLRERERERVIEIAEKVGLSSRRMEGSHSVGLSRRGRNDDGS